ncbi:MAG TPA: hypothetical protein VEZ11_08430, partial [Thermoanaerobaculia bacterium]|nr:hypothetical protein [Thermoanaerobaculia bacterium]
MIPPPIVLARGEVRVWYTRLAGLSEGEFAACRAILAAEEIERADRFRFESDRRASIAGRALARGALARCGGASPEAWVFALNE